MITAYHRPNTLKEALQLLHRAGIQSAVLNGQSILDAQLDDSIDEVVDLQALGLRHIYHQGTRLTVEALVSLQNLLEHPALPDALQKVILSEDNYTFRQMRTLGSLLSAVDGESQLIAALLVCDALLTIETAAGTQQTPLVDFLGQGPPKNSILTQISLDLSGKMAAERVSRTPADKAIVAVVGRIGADGKLRLALSGVAQIPVLATPEALEQLQPPGDFRGSGAYRRQMAVTLSRRVLDALGAEK